jgi:hypothetical protein
MMRIVKRSWDLERDKITGIASLICRIFGHRLIKHGRFFKYNPQHCCRCGQEICPSGGKKIKSNPK